MPRNLFVVIICLVFSGSGCILPSAMPRPRASDTLAQQSRTFVPPPGKANVYVVRRYNPIGRLFLFYVTLDFQEFGSLGVQTYLYGFVDPGDHLVSSANSNRLEFTAVSGRNYFFKVSQGWSRQIAALDEEDGRSLILDYTPSGDNRFELLGFEPSMR